MPSSYSGNLLLELMADGENDGLWGDITNENLEILGRAISGVTTVSLAETTHTLTVTQGTLSEGHFMVLKLGGSPTGTNTITIDPNTVARLYLVQNSSGQSAVFTQGSGANVTVADGDSAIIYCDGAGTGAAVTDFTADFTRNSNNLSDLSSASAALTNLGLTATAAELNKLDGFTGTAADLNYAKDLRATGVTTTEFNRLDGLTATAAELNKLDGFTGSSTDLNYAASLRATGVTTSEFNILDGLTASTAELNKLDGATVTTSELNKLDGFTGSATDLNYAASLRATGVTTAEFNILDGLTASTAELNKLDGFTGSATDLNYAASLRATGVTSTEFNYLDGVTSNIQTQLNGKITSVSTGGGLTGGSTSGSVTISHANTSSQGSVNTSGTTVIDSVSVDTYGHVTSMATRDMGASIRSEIGSTTFPSVGCYMLLRAVAGSARLYNNTLSGGSLSASDANGGPYVSGSNVVIIGGSWRCAGRSDAGTLTTADRANETTLWVRYA